MAIDFNYGWVKIMNPTDKELEEMMKHKGVEGLTQRQAESILDNEEQKKMMTEELKSFIEAINE